MRGETADKIIKEVDDALRTIMAKYDSASVVTKWYLAAKVEGGASENSGTWLLSPDHMDEQDDLGMLTYALVDTKTRLYQSFVNEEDED